MKNPRILLLSAFLLSAATIDVTAQDAPKPAANALRKLDKNQDGKLTADELRPAGKAGKNRKNGRKQGRPGNRNRANPPRRN